MERKLLTLGALAVSCSLAHPTPAHPTLQGQRAAPCARSSCGCCVKRNFKRWDGTCGQGRTSPGPGSDRISFLGILAAAGREDWRGLAWKQGARLGSCRRGVGKSRQQSGLGEGGAGEGGTGGRAESTVLDFPGSFHLQSRLGSTALMYR